jgi:hypothetical protein
MGGIPLIRLASLATFSHKGRRKRCPLPLWERESGEAGRVRGNIIE